MLHAFRNVAFIALFVLASSAPLSSTRAAPSESTSRGYTPGLSRVPTAPPVNSQRVARGRGLEILSKRAEGSQRTISRLTND